MADSIRQRIAAALDARLKGILVASGYETNLGRNVFAWRVPDLQEAELPAAIWRDTDCDDSSATIGTIGFHLHSLKMEIDLREADGTSTPASIRALIADLQKAIGVDTTWGGLAIRTNPLSSAIVVDQEEKIIGGANVTFTIDFYTRKWDPYNQ
jgi:hypothetical protein